MTVAGIDWPGTSSQPAGRTGLIATASPVLP